jgi:hypothetical protein
MPSAPFSDEAEGAPGHIGFGGEENVPFVPGIETQLTSLQPFFLLTDVSRLECVLSRKATHVI